MTKMLLAAMAGIAAIVVAAPASAQEFNNHSDGSHGFVSGSCGGSVMNRHHNDGHHDGFRSDAQCAHSDVVMDWYGGEWALYNNRSWDPDSYNDWWHDRPNRAYPHWMTTNQDCQRRWFAGDVLRC